MSNTNRFTEKITRRFDKLAARTPPGHACQVLVHSDRHNVRIGKSNLRPDLPFHVASIGKMFTATLIGILQDQNRLRIDEPVRKYLPADTLANLFVYRGTDYAPHITLRHLLGHTSGIADYFSSDTSARSPFVDNALSRPDQKWTPQMLLEFTRSNQTAAGAPDGFSYSDTGYILLGMIIERVYDAPFHTVLRRLIFDKAGMDGSYLMFYDDPAGARIAPTYFNGTDISKTCVLSCDWAGGGIVSTAADLVSFQRLYWQEKLAGGNFVREMQNIRHKFHTGIHYGLGMMELRLNEFFFLLPKSPRPLGHSGMLSTHMYYDRGHDLHMVVNLGSNQLMGQGIRVLIDIARAANRFLI